MGVVVHRVGAVAQRVGVVVHRVGAVAQRVGVVVHRVWCGSSQGGCGSSQCVVW